MKNLIPNKNWIDINKKAKENLNIFKEKTESDMLSEMNTELTRFSKIVIGIKKQQDIKQLQKIKEK